jgi:hypothetical protein
MELLTSLLQRFFAFLRAVVLCTKSISLGCRVLSPTTRTTNLDRLHSHHATQLFKNDKLDCCSRSKSRPDRQETTPEGHGALILGNLDHAINGIIVELGIYRLVHQPSSNHVKRRHGAGHEETGRNSREELRDNGLFGQTSNSHDIPLGLIIASHFGTVQDHGTGDIGVNTAVESADSLGSIELSCCPGNGWNLEG